MGDNIEVEEVDYSEEPYSEHVIFGNPSFTSPIDTSYLLPDPDPPISSPVVSLPQPCSVPPLTESLFVDSLGFEVPPLSPGTLHILSSHNPPCLFRSPFIIFHCSPYLDRVIFWNPSFTSPIDTSYLLPDPDPPISSPVVSLPQHCSVPPLTGSLFIDSPGFDVPPLSPGTLHILSSHNPPVLFRSPFIIFHCSPCGHPGYCCGTSPLLRCPTIWLFRDACSQG